jgi:hypothetical protein
VDVIGRKIKAWAPKIFLKGYMSAQRNKQEHALALRLNKAL